MAVDYPMPLWRTPASAVNLTSLREKNYSENLYFSRLAKSEMTKAEVPSNAYLFVLFIKLPAWESTDSYDNFSQIRTLRNLKNGVEVYQVKAALELSTGFPAHITSLVTSNDERLTDETRLVIGKNVTSGSSLRLEILDAWEDIVKAAWIGNLDDLGSNLPDYEEEIQESSSAFKQFSAAIKKSGRERAFSALFAASVRGHLPICKAILEKGFDPNLTTFFGNSALHAAANNGHFEIIQLLITHEANIRAVNSQKKTALDIAANCGFIDCARWLWLNQWSTGSSKTNPEVDASVNDQKTTVDTQKRKEYYSPAKPLRECTTLFTKPPQVSLPPMEPYLKGDSTPRASLKHENKAQRMSAERPKSSPLSWRINKSSGTASFTSPPNQPKRGSSRIKSASPSATQMRPATALVKRNQADLLRQSVVVPQILPQLAASLKRARSIPSVEETRFLSHKVANLRVDVATKSVVKPLTVDLTLNDRWINPKRLSEFSFSSLNSSSLSESYQSDNDRLLKSHSFLPGANHADVAREKQKINPPQNNRHSAPATMSASPIHEKNHGLDFEAKHIIDATVKFVNKPREVLPEQALKDSPHQRRILKLDSKEQQAKTSDSGVMGETTLNTEVHGSNIKSSSHTLDSYDTLHGNGETSETEQKQTKQLRFSMTEITNNYKKTPENLHPSPTPAPPKKLIASQSFPSMVNDSHYNRFMKKKSSADESKFEANLSRFEMLRKERSKKAWSEWKAAKQKEKAAQKMKQKEEVKKVNDHHLIRSYGITFDEWLAEKKKEMEKKQAIAPGIQHKSEVVIEPPVKTINRPHRVVTGGKTFDEWLRDKKEEKPREALQPKLTEEEVQRLNEKRQRNFAAWSARKLEEAKKEKRKNDQEEQEKKKSLNRVQDTWISKDRVMPFEAWKKRKEEERKKKEKEEAEQMEKVYVETWNAEKRKEQAEKEFKKWMNKKHSVMLERTAEELKEAKQEREETEKKLKARRALLHAKILMRWQRISRKSSKSRKNRSNSDAPSISLSTGDIAEKSRRDDIEPHDEKAFSENEDDVFRNNAAFKVAVARLKSQKKAKRSPKQLLVVMEKNEDEGEGHSKVPPVSETATNHSSSSSTSSDSETDAKTTESEKIKPKVKRKKKKLHKKSSASSSQTSFKSQNSVKSRTAVSNSSTRSLSSVLKENKVEKSESEEKRTENPKPVAISNKKKSHERLKAKQPLINPASSSPYATSVSFPIKQTKRKNGASTFKNSKAADKNSKQKPTHSRNAEEEEILDTQAAESDPDRRDRDKKSVSLTKNGDVSEEDAVSDDVNTEKLSFATKQSEFDLNTNKTSENVENEKEPEPVSENSEQLSSKSPETEFPVGNPDKFDTKKNSDEGGLSKALTQENPNSLLSSDSKAESNINRDSYSSFHVNAEVKTKNNENQNDVDKKGVLSESNKISEDKALKSPQDKTSAATDLHSSEQTKVISYQKSSDKTTNLKRFPKKQNTKDKNAMNTTIKSQKHIDYENDTKDKHEIEAKKLSKSSRPTSSNSSKSYDNKQTSARNSTKSTTSEADSLQPFGFIQELLISDGSSSSSRRQITISMPSAGQIPDSDTASTTHSD